MSIRKALTIAGSDTSGGAGIQADLKTFQERSVYGMTVLTTLVTMDPDNGWAHDSHPINPEAVEAQLKSVLEGIGVDAAKTGMLGSVDLIERVAWWIDRHDTGPFVVDPVMICKGTDKWIHPETADSLKTLLVPTATIVTPNLFEAGVLSGLGSLSTLEEMKEAAVVIFQLGPDAVLVKGGGKLGEETASDILYDGKRFELLESRRFDTTHTHGAGCTYSAAITAELAKGWAVEEAVRRAKVFITAAIQYGFPLNDHVGPVHHGAHRLFSPEPAQS
ncbi:pyridoxine/pyridoxal/pyridoxamine kinase [Desmospora profundinema]|uniref:pyridoxal kinase n=1 Tax=Desmospora profundinema TaxID=1571184 RepID=A0ABU1IME6_9BACL|nr:pyridoxine/pyridoxal/pyridoxamine kinase [Desmospora profundinema]MDR6225727.1 pyridoxine kinase [Desmospora profundinema]